MVASRSKSGEVFSRVWGRADLPPAVAEHVLTLGFTPADEARMHDLAARNRAGGLSADELAELDDYILVGDLIAVLQSKARRVLRVKAVRRGP